TKALLLAAPQHQERAYAVAQQLHTVCAEQIYISGPVDQRRLRLEEAQWYERTATAMSAWLWGAQPGHTALHQRSGSSVRRALGGVAWIAPRQAMQTWLAASWAGRVLLQMHGLENEDAENEASSVLLPPSPPRLLEELE